MMLPLPAFSRRNIAVTLRGDEWFTLAAVLCIHQRALSEEGLRILIGAKRKLAAQLTAESDRADDGNQVS